MIKPALQHLCKWILSVFLIISLEYKKWVNGHGDTDGYWNKLSTYFSGCLVQLHCHQQKCKVPTPPIIFLCANENFPFIFTNMIIKINSSLLLWINTNIWTYSQFYLPAKKQVFILFQWLSEQSNFLKKILKEPMKIITRPYKNIFYEN